MGVSLNLSPTQLAHGDVPTAAAEAAAHHGINTRLLGFDVAQPLLAANPPGLTEDIRSLRALGCWLMMDEVTAPEVNPQLVRELGFSGVKLDRSVIGRSVADQQFAATVREAVSGTRAQGLSMIGEGVDDEQRIEVVRELGCDGAQGFGFYGFPRAIEELLKLID